MSERIRYKVLVAEDELPILENLVQKLEALDLPIQIVGTASNGEDALALLNEHRPHILFTDIRMPLMDGLELIRRATASLPLLQVVIISGYDEFEYAQRALQYGAADYLLKPVNLARLRETTQRLCATLKKNHAFHEREILASGLSGHLLLEDLPFTINSSSFYMQLLCVGNLLESCHNGVNIEKINGLWSKMSPPQILNELLGNEQPWWLVDEKQPNCKMLISTQKQAGLSEALRAPLEGRAAVTVCAAAEPVPFAQIWETAQRLRAALRERLTPCVSSCFEVPAAEPPPPCPNAANCLGTLAIYCKRGQTEAAAQSILQYLAQLEQSHVTQRALEEQLLLLVNSLYENAGKGEAPDSTAISRLHALVANSTAERELYAALSAFFSKQLLTLFLLGDSSEELYVKLKQYIDKHYLSPITIDTIAEVFHFSPSYISRVFKKYNGCPPFKYLLLLRIEEAKRLIAANSEFNFRLISEMVGYPDAHYFSRLFRSTSGLSPTEYKKSLEAPQVNGMEKTKADIV